MSRKFTDEQKAKIAEGVRKYRLGKKHSEETKQKISKTMKENKGPLSEETRQKLSAINQGIPLEEWNGYAKADNYNVDYRRARPLCVERDLKTCQHPGCSNPGEDCHHINNNKNDNRLENLILLCRACHAKTRKNGNWKPFFQLYSKIAISRTMKIQQQKHL